MRKFTLLIASLFLTIGAMAQIAKIENLDNSKAYLLRNANGMGYAIWKSGDNLTLCGADSKYTEALDNTVASNNWQIVSYEGKYFLYNLGAQKFAVTQGGPTYLTETPTAISIQAVNKGFAFNSDGHSQHFMCASHQGHHDYAPIQFWTASDNGSSWEIIDNTENVTVELNAAAIVQEYFEKYAVIEESRNAINSASDTMVGAYTTAAVAEVSAALEAYDANKTDENLETLRSAYEALVENGEKVTLSSGEMFTVKCYDTNRGYMIYYKGLEDKAHLAATNKAEHPGLEDEGVYKEWAIVKHNGKDYIYNVEKKQYINGETPVQFTDTPSAIKFIYEGNNLWNIQFESNNRYLSYSPGWITNVVRAEGSIDDGCRFYLIKTGASVEEATVATVEASFVNAWKNNTIATLGYVGGYPATMKEAINAVSTLAGTASFDTENAASRVQFTPGYYFLQQTNTKKYITYNDTDLVVAAMGENEKPGINNVVKFVQEGENVKLQVSNVGKYVTLADAPAVSKIESDFTDGNAFTVENKGDSKITIKGNNQVMRTENTGEVNYWWGDTETTWYMIPVVDIEVSVNEFASIYLPFDVATTEGVTAYAIEATNSTHAILAEKTEIPAYEGAILAGNGTVKLNVINEATEDWSENLLEGTTNEAEISGYVLAKVNENIGLYATEEGFVNNANKAYLPATPMLSAAFYGFLFEGTTGVENVEVENGVQVIFDLTGRRIESINAAGIYIVNGKKVLVK